MWNNAALLGQIASIALVVAAVTGVIAALSGFVGGVAASRSSELTSEQASTRIAEANARAEEAAQETARLWAQMAWRRVSPEQHRILVEQLRGQTFEVWVTFVGDDPEATVFHRELHAALTDAGLQTHYFSGWAMAVGLRVCGPPSEQKGRLERALAAAGLPAQSEGPHRFRPNELMIIVGTKEEPERRT